MKLEIHEVSFAYRPESPILENVSLNAAQGEWVTLLGPNGTGKTTLLRCALNQLHPHSGTVKLDNRILANMSPRERAGKIAYVPQVTRMVFGMSVIDTVLTGRLAFSPYRYTKYDREVVAHAIDVMHLNSLAFRYVHELSGGERQRVWIARALAQEAVLLCMDEPTTGMDLENQLHLLELIRTFTDRGQIGVLMTLHDLNLASLFSDRIALLYGKHLYASGTPREVLTANNIRTAYRVAVDVQISSDGRPQVKLLRKARREQEDGKCTASVDSADAPVSEKSGQ